jgi:hypothetical protein
LLKIHFLSGNSASVRSGGTSFFANSPLPYLNHLLPANHLSICLQDLYATNKTFFLIFLNLEEFSTHKKNIRRLADVFFM